MIQDQTTSLVNLTISKEVVSPIVSAKIQEAVTAALGGADQIVKSVINTIINTEVDEKGNKPQYSSDKKMSWIDFHVTSLIQKTIKDELTRQLQVGADEIKTELIKQLQTKKGASKVAEALLSAFNGTFASGWNSKIDVSFATNKRD